MRRSSIFKSLILSWIILVMANIIQVKQIYADTGYSYDFDAFECYSIVYNSSGNSWYFDNNQDVNVVIMEYSPLSSGNYMYVVYHFSDVSFKGITTSYFYNQGYSCPANPGMGINSTHYTNNGYDFYYRTSYWTKGPEDNYVHLIDGYVANQSTVVTAVSSISNQMIEEAYQYYGVGPSVPAAGVLTFNYYTDFASNQQNTINSLKSNRDTITWDYNTAGSNIDAVDLKVDIRAVPTNYHAATQEDLLSSDWSDLNVGLSYAADLGSYQLNHNGRSVSFTWESVVDSFRISGSYPDWMERVINFWEFGIFELNNSRYWSGWVYQIRLNTWSGDYTGEWQTIYQVSSAPPEGSSQVINYYVNGTGITEPIYQTIQNINNQNNVTNNTWYVDGSPYNITGTEEGGNWLTTLIEIIVGKLSQLLSNIFSFDDQSLTIPDFDSNMQHMIDNTGIFGQSIQAVDQIKLRFDTLQDAEPVFSFPGFSLDEVQLVPAFEVNLNEYVQDMGLEGLHNTELLIMDGIVYISLILFAKSQLERILRQ